MSREMAHKVIVPPKKIMSRSFLNRGTLIVISDFLTVLSTINNDSLSINHNGRYDENIISKAINDDIYSEFYASESIQCIIRDSVILCQLAECRT
jgi:hypothetical protein